VIVIFGGLIMEQKWNAPINPATEREKTNTAIGRAKKALAEGVFWKRGGGAAEKFCRHSV